MVPLREAQYAARPQRPLRVRGQRHGHGHGHGHEQIVRQVDLTDDERDEAPEDDERLAQRHGGERSFERAPHRQPALVVALAAQ